MDKKIKCDEHPNEYVTNFCCNFECLKPLCPECIFQHQVHHQQNGTFPQIDSLKNVVLNCSKKIQGGIQNLQSEKEKMDIHAFEHPNDCLQGGIKVIRKSKEKLLSVIKQFYDSVEDVYTKRINDSKINSDETERVNHNILNLKNELIQLNNDLERNQGAHVKNTIRKICLLDLKQILDKQREDIYNITEHRNINPVNIMIDENRLFQINQELSKYITLDYHLDQKRSAIKQQQGQLFEQPFEVYLPDYFLPNTSKKFLHFFQNDEKRLHLLDISKQPPWKQFQVMNLHIDFKIPHFHKSIITPFGNIYLSGGSHPDNIHTKLKKFYMVDFQNRTLSPMSDMIVPRSSHCLCYMDGHIYAIGGISNQSKFTQKCERFELVSKTWQPIADLNRNAVASCCCSYNDKHIFKFGGILSPDQLNRYIEMYDPEKNVWELIDANITESPQTLRQLNFKFLSTSACAQINKNQLFIFGGYDEQNQSSTQSFLLEINEDDPDPDNRFLISGINKKPLPFAEAFWNNNPIIHGQTLIALQNVSNEYENDVCYEGKRRILAFNSHEWASLN